jgi:hypothetical protein
VKRTNSTNVRVKRTSNLERFFSSHNLSQKCQSCWLCFCCLWLLRRNALVLALVKVLVHVQPHKTHRNTRNADGQPARTRAANLQWHCPCDCRCSAHPSDVSTQYTRKHTHACAKRVLRRNGYLYVLELNAASTDQISRWTLNGQSYSRVDVLVTGEEITSFNFDSYGFVLVVPLSNTAIYRYDPVTPNTRTTFLAGSFLSSTTVSFRCGAHNDTMTQ